MFAVVSSACRVFDVTPVAACPAAVGSTTRYTTEALQCQRQSIPDPAVCRLVDDQVWHHPVGSDPQTNLRAAHPPRARPGNY